jgi:hypothetical protein
MSPTPAACLLEPLPDCGVHPDGEKFSHYYVPESVGIASGFLIAALHHAGLATLTHTPNPMSFLNRLCSRPSSEKPVILLVVGYPEPGCQVPVHGVIKKPLDAMSQWMELGQDQAHPPRR